jgi:hypothetical protein
MRRNQKTYNFIQLSSAVFMMLALLWLTISIPFVYNSQQNKLQKERIEAAQNALADTNEEESASTNPFGNNTEEKNPSSTSLSEEYLHDHFIHDHFFLISSKSYKCENVDTYVAFHGELLVPPPNQA